MFLCLVLIDTHKQYYVLTLRSNGSPLSQVVEAILRILYAADDDASVVEEAKAILCQQKKRDILSPISEVVEDKENVDTQKRKSIVNVEVDAAATNKASPRQRISDASDVNCSPSPLITF